MYKIGYYNESDIMSELICNNYSMILVVGRFGIATGFGDRTIGQVCESNNVDTNTFLSVVNLLISDNNLQKNKLFLNVSVSSIVQYLKNSHIYFADYKLPAIRVNLINALKQRSNDLADMVIQYFDEYVIEVKKHMKYEDDTVFVYVDNLLNGVSVGAYNIDIFSEAHDDMEQKLTEFRNVVIKYYHEKSSNELNNVLFDILSCAEDLTSHSNVEDYLFVPAIRIFEQNNK